jgi:hypothetical protein
MQISQTHSNQESAGERLVALAYEIWFDSFDKNGHPLVGGGLSGVGTRRSPQENEIFSIFVADGESEEFANAMIEFMRRPCTQPGDWTLVKSGVAMTDYMDELTEKGL